MEIAAMELVKRIQPLLIVNKLNQNGNSNCAGATTNGGNNNNNAVTTTTANGQSSNQFNNNVAINEEDQ